MQEGILNFGDPLGNYLIASSVKLPYSFVRAFGECPGYLIRWGAIFYGESFFRKEIHFFGRKFRIREG